MKTTGHRLSRLTMWVAAAIALLAVGTGSVQAQAYSPAARRIQSYYQQLLPTLQRAGQLSVRERDRRFTPAVHSAFDIGTMTRLAVGSAWSSFTPAQRSQVEQAFASFIIADYASQVSDYSGESFSVEPQATPAQGGELVKSKLIQSGGSAVTINYLMRGGRVVDVYLYGTISDLATRRDEFASILAAGGGAEALIKRLQEKTQSLLGG